ncbi:unnamed protein product [Phytomonas sp. EM1]|nr:unnamed protein product [Phytomonas sp. EM1]|eukprot:CCW62283.1 unnamed protein product [Phytomonas sp. isolate EM1]
MALPKLIPLSYDWKTPQKEHATSDFFKLIQDNTIDWWRRNQRRDLPWRPYTADEAVSFKFCDPYKIWVSEVMSQQTQMGTVIKYFNQWMSKFPSIEVLASSTEDEVRCVWSGMGYYRRANYLRKGAQYLVNEHVKNKAQGAVTLPKTSAELLKVPGIGPYTAAAIASICFSETCMSVDGNVFRVLCRLRGEQQMDPKMPKNLKMAYLWGQQLMRGEEKAVCKFPGELNQGLMELGASICRPNGPPLCSDCPLRQQCVAYSAYQHKELPAIEGVIPLHGTSSPKRIEEVLTVVHEFASPDHAASLFIMVQRPPNGLLGGMPEFPSLTLSSSTGGETQHFYKEVEALAFLSCEVKECPSESPSLRKAGKVIHIFSHIRMTIRVYHVKWIGKQLNQIPNSIGDDDVIARLANGLDKAKGCSNSRASIFLLPMDKLASIGSSKLLLKVLHAACAAERCQEPQGNELKKRRIKK